jgi:hypothetical protein
MRDASSRGDAEPGSMPSTDTVPRGGGTTPASAWMRVVLPAPFAPTIAVRTAFRDVEIDSVQDLGPSPVTVSPRARMIGGDASQRRSRRRDGEPSRNRRASGARRNVCSLPDGVRERGPSSCGVSGKRHRGTVALLPADRSAASVAAGSHTPIATSSSACSRMTSAAGPSNTTGALAVEHDRAGDEAHRRIEVVLHEQDRAIAGRDDIGERGVHVVDALRVEVRRRLVEHDQRRAHREGTRDREALPPAAGEPIGVLVAALPEPHPAQRLLGREDAPRRRQQQFSGPNATSSYTVPVTICASGSWNTIATCVLSVAVCASPCRSRPPRPCRHGRRQRVRDQSVQRERERRLARPGGPEQQHDLAGGDVERHVARRRVRGIRVGERELTHAEQGRGWAHGGVPGRRIVPVLT